MEIDVTHMVEDADTMPELSGSAAELGPEASRITWNNSKEYGRNHPLLKTDDDRDVARSYFKSFGAWDEKEIAAWSEDEIQGLTCQEVAGAIRELEHYDSYEEYLKAAEEGRCHGNLYKGENEHWYYYFGH
jgi:hypothetical protein